MKQHILYLDTVRVVACIFVVAIHCNPWLFTTPHGLDLVFSFGLMLLIGVAVPLFFMISGAVTLPVATDTLQFYKRRLPRIILPLLFWGIIYALLPYWQGKTDWNTAFHELLLVPIKTPHVGGVLWYLFVLTGLYLLAPFITSVFSSKRNEQIFLFIWFLASFYPLVHTYIPNILGESLASTTTTVTYFSGYLGYFVLGHYLHHYSPAYSRRNIWLALLILISGMALWGISQVFFHNAYSSSSLSVGAIMVAVSIFWLLKTIPLNRHLVQPVIKLAPFTFGIYLSQIVIIQTITYLCYVNRHEGLSAKALTAKSIQIS